MEVQIGLAKVSKYAMRESGDTVEFIERPHGGVSAVLVDGQTSGHAAKRISNIVARKAISLLGEGVRDGAVARAAHDYLRTHRGGQVSAELQMVSVDLRTRSVVISRNSRCAALIVADGQCAPFDDTSDAIGIYPNTKPVIREVPLAPGVSVVLYSDGLRHALDDGLGADALERRVAEAAARGESAQALADALMELALGACARRPRDDITVLVLWVLATQVPDGVRRMALSFPVDEEGPAPR
ncbi:MAG: PP2C family protein-serine/threonine phosphatase [Chloroflexota bacterium]